MITAIIPTLGRPSLASARLSLEMQSERPYLIILNDSRDTLIKIKEGFEQARTELVAICDDDAVYPVDWIEKLSSAFSPSVGYAGGAVVPHIKADSNRVEKGIGEVTSSIFGTSNMSYRQKIPLKTHDADETNLIGNGMYRRSLMLELLTQEYQKIPPAAWETYILTRMREMGYQTLSVKGAYFWHKQRETVGSFAKQIYRCGIGRTNYLKRFPREALKKYFILFPPIFVSYLFLYLFLQVFVHVTNFAYPPIWGLWPIISYLILDFAACLFTVKTNRILAFALFPLMHISYGIGILVGMLKNKSTWN